MSARVTALRIVERAPMYRKELDLPAGGAREAHSLHFALPYPESASPELVTQLVSRFSKRGEKVLDPFCGSGTTALESALQSRIAVASDLNPLCAKIVKAKLSPADLTEVTLFLQQANLKRPVDIRLYREGFATFFDIDTFRELCNLRDFLEERSDRVSVFVEMIALSLLHGHSAGYFSVYSFPQIALSPAEQEELNRKRAQYPDYRAVVPRLLRKTASSLRDGWSSSLRQTESRHKVNVADARNLHFISDGSIDLVVTAPPLPGVKDFLDSLWLRLWFSRLSLSALSQHFERSGMAFRGSLELWLEFMNEALIECARVLRSGGRCVLELRESRLQGKVVALDEELISLVQDQLGRFWEVEGVLFGPQRYTKLENCVRPLDSQGPDRRSRMVVLRRR